MDTFEITTSLALSVATAVVFAAGEMHVEEKLSSSSATPIPGFFMSFDAIATQTPVILDDASTVVRVATQTVQRLSFLPIDQGHESLVDTLVARKMAMKRSEALE